MRGMIGTVLKTYCGVIGISNQVEDRSWLVLKGDCLRFDMAQFKELV